MKSDILLLMVASCLSYSSGFRPTINVPSNMYTHARITREALNNVATQFLKKEGYVNTDSTDPMTDFFLSDNDGKQTFYQRLAEIADAVGKAYEFMRKDPKYTVNSEKIVEARNEIKKRRLRLSSILSSLSSPSSDSTAALQRVIDELAECLMILQSFYSNTNWVEMRGPIPYLNFSVFDSDLMEIATNFTCSSCDYTDNALQLGSCVDNLEVSDRLTSGYHLGQPGVVKPSATDDTLGKCSHGGNKDPGQNRTATGGINKETNDYASSPHAHLHTQSATAAILATEAFLFDEKTGLFSKMPTNVVQNILGLNNRASSSLAFAIDVSGSMWDDIARVTNVCKDLVTDLQGTGNEPEYILVTFNDPESLTTGRMTRSGQEMISWLEGLRPDGGGDCPEFALSGLLKAVDLSQTGGKIILATDADAKDTYSRFDLDAAAFAKNTKISFLLTRTCGSRRRKRDAHSRTKRDLATFTSIAESSGGTVYQISSSEINTVLTQIIQDEMPSSKAIIDMFTRANGESNAISIQVDSGISVLKITINGPMSVTAASLSDPSDTEESFTGSSALRYFSSYIITMSIQNPTPGTWTLVRSDFSDWDVNITASTSLDVDFQLIETDEDGIHFVLDRNPISGNSYTLAVIAYNLNSSSTSIAVSLVATTGLELLNVPLVMSFSASRHVGYVSITMPSSSFYVSLTGTDPSGFPFKRMSWKLASPVAVDLIVHPILGDIAVGEPQIILYEVTNFGDVTNTYDVEISDDKGRVTSVTSRTHTVDQDGVVTGTFEITGNNEMEYLSYTVTVQEAGSSIILQSKTYTLLFASSFCTIYSTINNCDNLGSLPCSSGDWSATAVFSFDVSTFIVTDGVDLTDHATDKTILYASGTCCHRNFTLNAYPSTGSGCQVKLDLGSNVASPTTTLKPEENKTTPMIGIAVGVVVTIILVIIILVFVGKLYLKKKASKRQVTDSTVDLDPFGSFIDPTIGGPITSPVNSAPISTVFSTKKGPLLEKDYREAYSVRPTSVKINKVVRPTSTITLHVGSRPSSLR